MNVNAFLQKDYENETAFRPKKTNPIKPNFFKGQNRLPKNPATPHDIQGKLLSFAANKGLITVTKCDIIMADKLSSKAH